MTGRFDRRRSERGQILPLLALTIITMGVMAMVAITFGQAMVRRQQAQMVVDAAALAGAAEQAKGLNTIARINEFELNILNGIADSQAESVYMDTDDTTTSRILFYGLYNDWAEENWESFQERVFDRLNQATDKVNYAYRVRGIPKHAAEEIVAHNFGPSSALFHDEMPPETMGALSPFPADQGTVVWADEQADSYTKLVKLTEPQEYSVGGARLYVPYFDHYSVTCDPMEGLNVPCDIAKSAMLLNYFGTVPWSAMTVFAARAATGSHPTYKLGKFYANDESHDVRFTYFLRVPAVTPVVAKDFFKEIPAIEVVATAKPYQGHLGAEFQSHMSIIPPDPTRLFFVGRYTEQNDKTIRYTYKAKLIAVRGADKKALSLYNFNDRYFSIMH